MHIFEISPHKNNLAVDFYPKNCLESINIPVMIVYLSEAKRKIEKFELSQAFSKHVTHQNFVRLTPAVETRRC